MREETFDGAAEHRLVADFSILLRQLETRATAATAGDDQRSDAAGTGCGRFLHVLPRARCALITQVLCERRPLHDPAECLFCRQNCRCCFFEQIPSAQSRFEGNPAELQPPRGGSGADSRGRGDLRGRSGGSPERPSASRRHDRARRALRRRQPGGRGLFPELRVRCSPAMTSAISSPSAARSSA